MDDQIRPIGHNGGPPIDDELNAKMRWAKVNITEVLEGMEGLTLEERGFYVTGFFKMYARMRGFPADDREGARLMGCDVRMFRRLRDRMVAAGKFYIDDDGLLKNRRVEWEIAEFCREARRRRDAALEREARRRQEQSNELPRNFRETSAKILKEVPEKLRATLAHVQEKFSQKPNEINECDAATVPQPEHEAAGTRTKNQEPEPKEEPASKSKPEGLAGLNGASEPMLRDIMAWMVGGDEVAARNWLSKLIQLHGQEVVRESYMKLSTDILSGQVVARPLQAWGQIATRMRGEGRKTKAEPGATPIESTGDKIRRFAEAAEEQARLKKGMRP